MFRHRGSYPGVMDGVLSWRAVAVLLSLCWWFAGPALGQGNEYEPIRPIESRSNSIGMIDQVPLVSYNEYSGSVSIDLTVGVDGLSIPIHYSNQQRTLADVFPLPNDSTMGSRYFGAGWYVGYGVLSPSGHEPTHLQIFESDRPTEYDRVLFREPNGAENELKIDLFFQQIPSGDNWYNFHFLDSRLRRLERLFDPQNPQLASDTFVLLDRDGSRTTFRSRSMSPTGGGFFFPVEIEKANGRKLTMTYCDSTGSFPSVGSGGSDDAKNGGACSGDAPLLQTVSDDWGRTLRLHYVQRPATGWTVLDHVTLEAPGHADQDLMFYEYEEAQHISGLLVTELRAQRTPEGHRTTFYYGPTEGTQPVNLRRVELPSLGVVELSYKKVIQFICPYTWVPGQVGTTVEMTPVERTRVEHLSYGGETYEYDYHQGWEYSAHGDYDTSWVVTMKSTVSEIPYERLTQYFQASANMVGVPDATPRAFCEPTPFPNLYAHLAGRPWRRLQAYGGPESGAFRPQAGGFTFNSGGSHQREEWSYRRYNLLASGHIQNPKADVLNRIPLVHRYIVKKDDQYWDTQFEYKIVKNTLAGPSYDRPTRILQSRTDQPLQILQQDFAYESRAVGPHGLDTSIADQPHVLALPTLTSQSFVDHGTTSQVALEEYTYEDGRHPLLLQRKYHFSPSAAETTDFGYYAPGHAWQGMLASETRLGDVPSTDQTTTFEGYDFGVATLVQPPLGPPIERLLRPDGTPIEQTKDGVTIAYEYDADRRLVRSQVPGSGQLPREVIYSGPGEITTKTERIGGRDLIVEVSDPWNRVVEKRLRIDASTLGITRTHYDSLGLVASETNASGAERSYTYDVLGRRRSVRTFDAQGERLEEIDIVYSAPGGGLQRQVETRWNHDDTASTVRETESDYFGRRLRTETHNGADSHQTRFEYRFVDGLLRTLILPAASEPRLQETDWFGRRTLECHPEMFCLVNVADFAPDSSLGGPPVQHTYDTLGRLIRTQHTDGSTTVSHFDALDRLTLREEVSSAGLRQETIHNVYDLGNNQLLSSRSTAGGLSVATEHGDFDVLQRPLATAVEIPPAATSPVEPKPSRYWLFGDSLDMSWEGTVSVDLFEVVFERLAALPPGAPATPPLIFRTLEEELVLRRDVIEQAVADLTDPTAAQPFLDDLDADEDFLLDPEIRYRWRVYGWRGDEPTLATAWQLLDKPVDPDSCHFGHFRVRDGVNEGALVEWSTNNCPEDGPLAVEIRSSSLDATAACTFEDVVFASDKNGPRRALFMITGYDMVDGQPTFPADFNHPGCPGLGAATFRGSVVDEDGHEIHAVGPQTGHVLSGDICDVRNVNVIDGLNGTAPVVRWETESCEGHTVEVLAEAEVDASSPNAAQCRDAGVLASGLGGQVSATFMLDGYIGLDNQSCGPVDRAWFRVRTRHPTSGEVFETSPVLGYVEPVGGFPAGCYTRLFTESSAPGVVPIVAWEARNCEGYEVELTRTAVGHPSDLNCLVRNDLWQTEHYGVRDARFMIDGYEGIGGVSCDPVADMLATGNDRVEFDFRINVRDPATGSLIEPQSAIMKTLRATYTLPPTGTPGSGPCTIDYLATTNGFFGHQPLATWGTSGDCTRVELQISSDPYLQPVSCRLNGQVWSSQPDGPSALSFMVGGYDYGLGNNHDGQWDCVGDPGANGTYGEALLKAYVALEVTRPDDSKQRFPESGGLLVVNFNDQSQTTLPGPNDPCEIIDFSVDQPALPGHQATDTLPTIRWNTTCPAQSLYSVRVYASAESVDHDPTCRLDDLLFGSSKNGPQPAIFMRSGWWDYVIGEKRCYANRATFRMEIVEDATGIVLPGQVRDPIEVTYSGEFEGEPPIGACEGGTCSAQHCNQPYPSFGGLTADPTAGSECRARLDWLPGTAHCGGDISYTVYRSSVPFNGPEPAYLLAEGVQGTTYFDDSIDGGGTYYYLVAARDEVSRLESSVGAGRRLINGCTQSGHSFVAQPSTVQAGQTTTLSWDFPDSVYLYLVGYGEQPSSGQLTVSPSATTLYQFHVTFDSGGQGSFTAEVQVQGGQQSTPVAGGLCHRPCGETVMIDGEEHFCRGFGAWDGDYEVTQPPVWLSVSDWPDYVEDAFGEPLSPYCLKAVCGAGAPPPNRWHPPEASAAGWISDAHMSTLVEFPGDGLDNDCDEQIDESGQ